MEKKKNKKNDKWVKAKPILLKILHGVSYVFSAIFIGLCVYACASSGSKKDNQKPIKQQHNEIVYVAPINGADYDTDDFDTAFTNDVLYDLVYTPYQRLDFDPSDLYTLSIELYGFDGDYFYLDIRGVDYSGYVNSNYDEITFYVYYAHDDETINLTYTIETNIWSFTYNSIDYVGQSNYVFNRLMDTLGTSNVFYPLGVSQLEISDSDNPLTYNDLEVYDYFINYDNDTLFGGLTNSTSSFIGTLNSGLTDMISIFYDDGITTIGTITLIVVAVSLVWVSFRLISSKVRLR